jgi:hypothetical protein
VEQKIGVGMCCNKGVRPALLLNGQQLAKQVLKNDF